MNYSRNIHRAVRGALTLILAGGQGERLYPLTKERSKPSVPFGGRYRIIDFTLSNCLNSGFFRIYLLTQYLAQSLVEHIYQGWHIFSPALGEFIHCVSPQQKIAGRWYEGTADAVFHNINLLADHRPEYVLILSGDHIYKMDYTQVLEFHIAKRADATLAVLPVPREEGSRFGIVKVDADHRVVEFIEKPADPPPMPGRPEECLVNMGIYIFNTEVLVRTLSHDARQDSAHDFGKSILPILCRNGGVYAFPFEERGMSGRRPYWKDIGTIDSYYEANMDLLRANPPFDLYDEEWPIRTLPAHRPPALFIEGSIEGGVRRKAEIIDSMIGAGTIIHGGSVIRSQIGPNCRLEPQSSIEGSILFENAQIGPDSRIRNAIIDKNVRIPGGFQVGFDREEDEKRFLISPGGVTVIPKGMVLED